MILIVLLLIVIAAYFLLFKLKSTPSWLPVVLTLLYWLWESRVGGNIRVDLLIIYPILFSLYLKYFSTQNRAYALAISVVLMAVNFGFFLLSYQIFDKPVG